MAVASAWAKPGSWALAAEEQDDLPPPPPVPASDFPDLATAATTKVPKKKKAQPVSLASFNSAKFVPSSSRGPTPDMLISLPTGPRERTEEELGGARWGNVVRGSDEPRRGGSGTEDYGPSRADEADDWGIKKPMERKERMGGFGADSLMSSRADDVDDWVSTKKTAPSLPMERRERSSAFGSDSQGRADDSTSWVSNKSYSAPPPVPLDGRRGGSVWGFNRDGTQDPDSWARRREEVSSGGGNRAPRPRLVLQKRTLPVAVVTDGEKNGDRKDDDKKAEDEAEDKGESQPKSRSSNPFGAARPREEVLAAKGENLTKQEEEKLVIQPKVRSSNPFGAARPREEVLAAKGEDWRKIDEKLDAMKVREAPPERRSSGTRGSAIPGEETMNGEVPDSHADSAWKKPVAVEAAGQSEQGSDATEETAPAK